MGVSAQSGRSAGITFHNRGAFWFGVALVTLGVVLQVPMFVSAKEMGYALAGEPVDATMTLGMIAILVGLAATFYGLFPRLSQVSRGYVARVRVKALDDAKLNKAHLGLLLVMAAAVTIDVMKPVTLGFVVPGMAKEYGLKSPLNPAGIVPVAWLPLSGITGTVIGSFLWGWLGDKIGRRSSILLAGVLFVATSICGAMPNYRWNFVMCFVMGLGVGGMLPITFAMMAEVIPARHRGWLMVLIGGDVAGAYIITSWLASTIGAPDAFGWRILWLLGLPTGVILILLNRWIPESPRYLIANGRDVEARAVMERYGAKVVEEAPSELEIETDVRSRWAQLVEGPFLGLSLVVALFGLGVGLVTFGFQLWIPSNLQKLGFTEVTSDRILRDSALIGFPATFVIAWLYGFWSSRKTLVLLGIVTAGALLGFVIAGDSVATNKPLLYGLLVIPITGISSILAVLIAYASEAYPTRIRARGTGLAAGASKAGGVLIIALVVAAVAPPSIAVTAAIGAVPMALAAILVGVLGVETRRRRLEEITAEELNLQLASAS
ncbi:MAG TPA: MFS transporter [Actinomycetota bacterium]|jgi:putative MFS transporter|nr:MFS transporter [Actinomycetota bacterium]